MLFLCIVSYVGLLSKEAKRPNCESATIHIFRAICTTPLDSKNVRAKTTVN